MCSLSVYSILICFTTAESFWRHQFGVAETVQEDFKTPELPLARVKRVMKTDPEVAVSPKPLVFIRYIY